MVFRAPSSSAARKYLPRQQKQSTPSIFGFGKMAREKMAKCSIAHISVWVGGVCVEISPLSSDIRALLVHELILRIYLNLMSWGLEIMV